MSHMSYESLEAEGDNVVVGHVKDEWPTDIKFQTCLKCNHLTQLVTFPTHRSTRDAIPKSTLDLIIIDDPNRLITLAKKDIKPKGQGRCLITGAISTTKKEEKQSTDKPRLIWSLADYKSVTNHLKSYD